MRPPTGGAVRLLRAGASAGAVLGLALAAHAAGGGRVPPAGVVAVVAPALVLVTVLLTRRRMGAPTLAALLGAGQLVLHRIFGAVSAATCAPGAGGGAGQHAGGHAAGVVPVCAAAPAGTAMPHGVDSTAMLAAHVAATALCVLLLLLGERAVFALWCWLAPLAVLLVAPVPVVDAPQRRPRRTTAVRVPRGAVLRVAPRRGPPASRPALQLAA